MFPLLFLSLLLVAAWISSTSNFNQLDKMSLSFQVEQKPFPMPQPKPKGKGKDKFRDLMAIVKWSGMGAVAGSGKIGGTVMLSNNVWRVWHKTKTVRDTATNLVKGVFSGVSSAFRTLSPAELLAWQNSTVNYIRKNALAEIRHLTSNQAFQRINNILLSIGRPTVTTPPGVGSTDTVTGLSAIGDVSAQTLLIQISTFANSLVVPSNTYAKVYATPQFGASKQKFSKSDYRFIGFYAPGVATNPLDVTVDYLAAFGAITLGSRIGFAVQYVFSDSTDFKENGRVYGDTITVA